MLVWIVAMFVLSDVTASGTFISLEMVESDPDFNIFFAEQAMDFFMVVVIPLQLGPI